VDGRPPAGKPIQLWTSKQKNAEQLDQPIPLLMRKCDEINAPYITGPTGEINPMMGEITLAPPSEEPVLETAIRIAEFAEDYREQGITRSEAALGVRADAYTARRKDSARAWKQKIALAIDLALRLGLLETVSGQRLGARYERGQVSVDEARRDHIGAVMGEDDFT
jgi:hypothetical protein